MSSPAHQRSASGDRDRSAALGNEEVARSPSRARSRTPDPSNGARRSRSRSPSRGRTRSRSRSYRERSSSHSKSRSPSVPRSSKIVIEKLTKNVNEAHLKEIFGTYGAISELEMPMNKQFMMNRGIAYILYTSPTYAESAIAHMHEAQLDGTEISVSIVLPRRRFSRSPPPRRPPPNRFGEPHRFREAGARPQASDRAYGRPVPPPRASPGFRGGGRRSPPPGGPPPPYRGGRGGYRDRTHDDRDVYRPRSRSPSRSLPRRRRSPSYSNRDRSHSRSPPRRRAPSPPPSRGGGGSGGGRRRRSPSYSSYSSRSRSGSRNRGGRR